MTAVTAVLAVLAVVVAVLAAEGLAFLLYVMRAPERRKRALEFLLYQRIRPFSLNSHRASHTSISRYSEHPFTGWSLNPDFISHEGERVHNRQGFRCSKDFEELDPEAIRIYCAGGSATYSLYIENNQDTWPELLGRNLADSTSRKVEVINAGVGSFTTYQSYIRLSAYIDYLRPDVVIVYHAKNDLTPIWRSSLSDEATAPDYSNKIRPLSFRSIASSITPAARWSYMGKLWAILRLSPEDTTMSYVYGPRRQEDAEAMLAARADYSIIETMQQNLVSLCRGRGIPLVYMTQRVDDPIFRPYIEAINDRVRGLENTDKKCFVFDLDRTLPHDPTFLVDEMHFSLEGNRAVAESVGKFFLETALLASVAKHKTEA